MSTHDPRTSAPSDNPPVRDWSNAARTLADEGAVCLPAALSEAEISLVEAAFDWMIQHPGPGAEHRYTHEPATFYESTGYAPQEPVMRDVFERTAVLDLVRGLYGSEHIWYLGEQLFWKHSGHARRTPWHQDLSYLPFSGSSLIGLWISLGDLPKEACLEFVRGSHRGVLYNGASYLDLDDDTHPLYPDSDMPRLPDIEADRGAWDIISWPLERGDVIAFHIGALHGGAGTTPDIERRTLTLRFFGADAVWTKPLPEANPEAFSARRSKAVRESGTRPAPTTPPVPGQPLSASGQFVKLS